MRKLIDRFTESRTHPHTVRLFRRVIYGWCLMSTLLLLPAAGEFWGPNALIPPHPFIDVPLLHLFQIPLVQQHYTLFLAIHIVAALIYVTDMSLNNRAWIILDGGDNLIQLMLFYVIFMDPSPVSESSRPRPFSNAMSNAAFLIARLQVVAVYLVAGLAKIDGELWQNGTALYYTSTSSRCLRCARSCRTIRSSRSPGRTRRSRIRCRSRGWSGTAGCGRTSCPSAHVCTCRSRW